MRSFALLPIFGLQSLALDCPRVRVQWNRSRFHHKKSLLVVIKVMKKENVFWVGVLSLQATWCCPCGKLQFKNKHLDSLMKHIKMKISLYFVCIRRASQQVVLWFNTSFDFFYWTKNETVSYVVALSIVETLTRFADKTSSQKQTVPETPGDFNSLSHFLEDFPPIPFHFFPVQRFNAFDHGIGSRRRGAHCRESQQWKLLLVKQRD